jgi:RimJ/RimL family protein N-acetyltransferase
MARLMTRASTERLILEPIGPEHADELWLLHQDPVVAYWYGGPWSRAEAAAFAKHCALAWATDGVCKWIARDRASGGLVGRGGLSRMPADAAETLQIQALLAEAVWERDRLELGWALFSAFQGRGFATEIGQAGLRFALEVLGAEVVIAYTERINLASRRVMERLGLHLRGEIHVSGSSRATTTFRMTRRSPSTRRSERARPNCRSALLSTTSAPVMGFRLCRT